MYSYSRISKSVKRRRLELPRLAALPPQSSASTIPPPLHCIGKKEIPIRHPRLCAQDRSRTCTPLDTRTWNVRVYQFRHLGIYLPYMSGKRDSNSRPQPWQGCALPTELFPQMKGAKTSSGMSPNEISFSVSQCFAVQLSCLRLQRYTFFFIQQTFPYSFLRNNPKFLARQGNLSQLGS